MFKAVERKSVLALSILLVIGLAACQAATTSAPASTGEDPAVTQPVEDQPVVEPDTATASPVAIDTPEPPGPRTLVYCTQKEPDSLYLYFDYSSGAGSNFVWWAIYDDPLEKLPSLADGDAQLIPVEVDAGDRVVGTDGEPVALEPGVYVRPRGCQADDCAVEYDGSPGFLMDQLSATFQLLPGLTWSDGEPLTAADSVYSFNLAGHPDTPGLGLNAPLGKYIIARTASYTALDDFTINWVGLPGFLTPEYPTAFWQPLPEHLWGHLSPAELLTAEISTQKPVGWGPYVIEERIPGESIILAKNEHYFRADEGLPRIDRLVFRFIGEDENANASLARLISGECDFLDEWALAGRTQSLLERVFELSASGRISLFFSEVSGWRHLDFGILPASYDDGWQPGDRPDFFGDVRTRRAFALCVDREHIADLTGPVSVMDTYLSPQHPLSNPDVKHYDFDPAAGSALLEEVGWVMGSDGVRVYAGEHPRIPAGTRLSLRLDLPGPSARKGVRAMVDSLAACGIEVSLTFWDSADFFALVWGRNFDLVQFWYESQEPWNCGAYISQGIPGEENGWNGYNHPGFTDPEFDRACVAVLQLLPGQPGYDEGNLRAQEIFAEQLPVIPLYFTTDIIVTRPDFCPLEGIEFRHIEAYDYGPDC